MDSDEKELIERAGRGDDGAFERIVDIYKDRIYSVSLNLTGNYQEAQEIAQQVFIKLWKNISKFGGSSSFSTWLYRLAHNVFYDYLRKQKRERSHAVTSAEAPETESTAGLSQCLSAAAAKEALRAALAEIPPEFASAVVYYDLEGRSYREISQITGKPEGTVKSRLCRGRELLRKKLGNILGPDGVQ
jgi:RNA polymerase sigma-70 factor (ECF subfamily)